MKRKWGRGLLTAALLLGLCSSAMGFDGNRKGFVLGGGVGVSPVITATNSEFGVDLSSAALATQFFIGHAWDDRNMLVFEINASYSEPDDWYSGVEFVEVLQELGGACWYHYYGERGASLFSAVGVGFYVAGAKLNGEDDAGSGIGYELGAGYEFAKQVQVGAYLIGGQSDGPAGTKNGHIRLSILLTVVGY